MVMGERPEIRKTKKDINNNLKKSKTKKPNQV